MGSCVHDVKQMPIPEETSELPRKVPRGTDTAFSQFVWWAMYYTKGPRQIGPFAVANIVRSLLPNGTSLPRTPLEPEMSSEADSR